MSNILCSIIIPYYNVPAELVNKCLSSILNQNWENNLYEVIFINDGSPTPVADSTKSLFKEFPHFTYIQQENQGPGIARNKGIKSAHGKYLFFLDSDDYWIEHQLNKLLPYLKVNEYDIIQFSTINFNPLKSLGLFEVHFGYEYMASKNIMKGVVTYCYKTEFIKSNNIYMPTINNSEDDVFLFYAFYFAKKCIFTNIDLYYYLQTRKQSLTKQTNSSDWNLRISYSINGLREIISFIKKQHNISSIQHNALNRALYIFVIDIIYHIFNSSLTKKDKLFFINELKNLSVLPLPDIINSPKYNLFRFCSSNYYLSSFLCKILSFIYNFRNKLTSPH